MPDGGIIIAGDSSTTEALARALRENDHDARIHAQIGLADSLVALERELGAATAAGAVGSSPAALALALTAAKLGTPLAACPGPAAAEDEDSRRAIATLASLEVTEDAPRAAALITDWLAAEPSARNLDSRSLAPDPRTPR